MPFSNDSLEHYAFSSLPHLAQVTLQQGIPAKRTGLALTAPQGYVTHLVMPACLAMAGYDVLHVPLAKVLHDEGVAQDLVDWLCEPGNMIHAISTVTAMMPLLLDALAGLSGGQQALELLRQSLRVLYNGGSELTPSMEQALRNRLDYPPGAYKNVFASTEGGVTACSGNDFDLFHGSLHSHVLSLLPLREVERAQSDPEYVPKSQLLTRAPVGLIGELAITFDGAVPWVNLRQGDIFEVVPPTPGSDVPRLRYLARLSSVQDVGGGRVWPASYTRVVESLDGKVTDYMAMALKPGDTCPDARGEVVAKDRLLFYYEGIAELEEVTRAIFENIPILNETGPKLGVGTFDMTVSCVRPGTLRAVRSLRSRERGGAPGPLKHQAVRGLQYQIPDESVLHSAPAWTPAPRWSGIQHAGSTLDQASEPRVPRGSEVAG